MANLFEESDFSLFVQYQGKTQKDAPDGHSKLRKIYDKLGYVLDALRKKGYNTDINRNPLIQGGPATMKYCHYHWSKIYPKEYDLFKACEGKVFFVVGSTQDGIDVHIDSNSRKGYNSDVNKVTKTIKEDTWLQISPQEASSYSCDDLADKVDNYIKQNWIEFNRFAKEFDVQESIEILKKMDINNICKLLLNNYNIILTGAPGTGKTYLAKEIAKSMGAICKLVQFHPSYDYTDFVEGLRPIKNAGKDLGFDRKDGVFKKFCKDAIVSPLTQEDIRNVCYSEDLYKRMLKSMSIGCAFKEKQGNQVTLAKIEGTTLTIKNSNNTEVSFTKEKLKEIIKQYPNGKSLCNDYDHSQITGNSSAFWAVAKYYYEYYYNNAPHVFIIDEINRGEISKIFGELFYSIDTGYRGLKGKVDTQYQNLIDQNSDDIFKDGFFVPENVYIIGTMNDIDRSVESMDFAMRRRFAWKEITAESRQSMLDAKEAWGNNVMPAQNIINEIKIRMNNLNACIIDEYKDSGIDLSPKDKIGLTKAYQIGASYFLKYGLYANNASPFEDLWANHIEGLLYEYLRGTTNIKNKIDRLHSAYNDTIKH